MMMRRRLFLAGMALAPALPVPALAGGEPAVSVWKDRNCGCCNGWVTHLRGAGFAVSATDTDDMAAVKRRLGVPEHLQSCHTAQLGSYVLEGHVPAADIRRLLAERPAARGLAVPGMPASAPGMDQPGQPYEVLLFGPGTGERVFARY